MHLRLPAKLANSLVRPAMHFSARLSSGQVPYSQGTAAALRIGSAR